ncbi:hypothetical protein K490DRAFT_34131 [Saccharata proteae CBS 121410]|uniref:Uncharacterized protein n=1 Tax=Saccharata proteae CBS 121410 TaxID=1314787 RepID=A0A9P4I0T5_9PEZI|nr:hypothetical protein K490DRAFT_34131 [Saccharata proteae CBS 121410]
MAAPRANMPHVPLSTRQLSFAEAQQHIAAFLSTSKDAPHLHPDSFSTQYGVEMAMSNGPDGGLTMQSLRRVEAGLRGEQLEPLPDPSNSDDMVLDGLLDESEKQLQRDNRAAEKKKGDEGETEGWMDMDEWQREQQAEAGDEVGEIGKRSNFVGEGGRIPEVVEEGGKMDKEARKKAKKERAAAEKKEREAKRREQAQA